jgi:hypothetical protein
VGEYTIESFVVHKISTARIGNVASIQGTSQERFRQRLVTDMIAIAGHYFLHSFLRLFCRVPEV